jgi:hypothetical protein
MSTNDWIEYLVQQFIPSKLSNGENKTQAVVSKLIFFASKIYNREVKFNKIPMPNGYSAHEKHFLTTVETTKGGIGLLQRFEIVPDGHLIHTRNRGF